MTRALLWILVIAAAAACGDDGAGDGSSPDAAPTGDGAAPTTDAAAPATDAAASDAAASDAAASDAAASDAGTACERLAYDRFPPISPECARCACIACRPAIEACDETCRAYVSCLSHCAEAVDVCDQRCSDDGDAGLTPLTEEVSFLAICIGNICPMECDAAQSL